MKISISTLLLLTLSAFASHAFASSRSLCDKICIPTSTWKYRSYKCPRACKTVPCYKKHTSGVRCVPLPKPTKSATPTPTPTPSPIPLPKGCAKVCVVHYLKYKYTCPHYCITKKCSKFFKKGIKCVPKPTPSATPSPSPKPKPACEDKCRVFGGSKKVKKTCNPHLCVVEKCKKFFINGLICKKKPAPKKPCPGKCTTIHAIKKAGCDEKLCSIDFCKSKGHIRLAKCVPRY